MGIFIQITIADDQVGPKMARRLASICPVDIFALEGTGLVVRPTEEDECTLCGLCLEAAPAGAIVIHKLYNDERLVSRGSESEANS